MRMRTRILLGLLTVVVLGIVAGIVYFNYPPPGKGGVTGRFWDTDDTGLPDTISNEGTFLVIPGVTVREVWPKQTEDYENPWYSHLSVKYDFEQLQDQYGATLAEVQFNGRFRIHAPDGPVVICSVRGGSGCKELDLPKRGSLRATRGEGGFWIEVK